MASLAVRSLARRARPGLPALNGVSLEIEDGRIAALIGPPGTGKSALLRAIAGLDPLDRGEVLIDGSSVLNRPTHERRIGLVFQDLALFETRTARDNVAFGMRARGWDDARRAQQADDLLARVGLAEHAGRPVAELSPEARGRVALARAVGPRPDLLLLDEPAATLGELQRSLWRDLLGDLLRDFGITALVATQDVREAAAYADILAVFMRGQVLQLGPTDRVLASPSSTIVATLVGYQRLIDGEWREGELHEGGVGFVTGPEVLPIEATATAMAHPSAMLAIPAEQAVGSGLVGTVERVIPDGPAWRVRLRLDATGLRTVVARWEWDLAPPAIGAMLAITVIPGTLRFFTSSGHAFDRQPRPVPYRADARITETERADARITETERADARITETERADARITETEGADAPIAAGEQADAGSVERERVQVTDELTAALEDNLRSTVDETANGHLNGGSVRGNGVPPEKSTPLDRPVAPPSEFR